MGFIATLFYLSIFFIFYSLFLYIPVVWIIYKIRLIIGLKVPMNSETEYLPQVSLIISVYNEEKVIQKKIQNTLQLNYPAEKLEIIVVSDASNDDTEKIVEEQYAGRVRLIRQAERKGKSEALNQVVPYAQGEIIVFSDANAMYHPLAVKHLAKHFHDRFVGFVTGHTKYLATEGSMTSDASGLYARLELLTKKLESRMGACVGADGAIFAIRKDLFRPLAAHDINDFVIPLQIIEKGYAGLLEQEAVCAEVASVKPRDSFNRQVRITVRTIRAIVNFKHMLNPFRYPLFAFELMSHKLCRFSLPFFLIIAFIANMALLGQGTHYVVFFLLQCGFYLSACAAHFSAKEEVNLKVMAYAYNFCVVCAAYLWGWIKYFSGEKYVTWAPGKN